MFLKARHWPVGAFAFHVITAKRTLQIGTSSPACAATFVLSSPLVLQDGLARAVYTATECVWNCPIVQRSSKNKNTRRYSSLAGNKHCGDVCGCKRSQKVEGHDRLRLQQTRQLMMMMSTLYIVH